MNVEALCAGWVGRTIGGRFTLLECLSSSESSAVFLTELTTPEPRKAVIKLVAADGVAADQLLGSWAMATTLSHEHLLRVYHTGQWQLEGIHCVYIVSEFADEVLSEILPTRPLTVDETRELLVLLVDALSWLHAGGFVHGRLRPSNILVVGEQLKLSSDTLLTAGAVRASLQPASIYDAPENGISPAADIWSLGTTLVEALTQHPPTWDRSTDAEPVVPDSMPQPFASIARACLRPIPTYRCSLADITAQLESKIETPPAPAPPPAPHIHHIQKEPSFKIPVMPMVVVLAVVFGIIAILALHRHDAAAPAEPAKQAESTPVEQATPAQTTPASPRQTSSKPRDAKPAVHAPAAPASAPAGSPAQGAVTKKVLPDVPHAAQATIHGTVQLTVRVAVDASGKVTDASLVQPGPSKYFARLALEASRSWEFTPPGPGGQPGPSSWLLRYQLRSDAIDATARQETP